jgi:L-alanine-DL-glutamate epimerase-like enolase superfamily enzyme
VGGLDEPHCPQRSLERLRLAREPLGPEVKLMMDAHGALTVDRAVRLGGPLGSRRRRLQAV